MNFKNIDEIKAARFIGLKKMNEQKALIIYKLIGSFLILCGVFGFLIVADELRHTGELIGVSCIFLAGIILLIVGFNLTIFRKLSLQWLAYCILFSIAIGGFVLDNMLLGVGIGIIIGIILATLLGKKKGERAYTANEK
jgi:hypothetical protein